MAPIKYTDSEHFSHASRLTSEDPSGRSSSRVSPALVAGIREGSAEDPRAVNIRRSDAKTRQYNKNKRPSKAKWFSELSANKNGKNQLTDEASIARPVAGRARAHRIRPSVDQISGPIPISQALPQISIPAFQNPIIDKRNLGTACEGLHSHPPMRASHAARKSAVEAGGNSGDVQDTKANRRKIAICENDDRDSVVLMRPRPPSADLPPERRQGRIFPARAWEINQTVEPAACSHSDSLAEEQKPEQSLRSIPIPTITLTPPSDDEDDDKPPQRRKSDRTLLSVNSSYKILHERGRRENRGLLRRLESLKPLAWLVSEAEGIDVKDTMALAKALRDIIVDRQMLRNLMPLAITLCEDQGIEFSETAFGELPSVLNRVLEERERAVRAAAHHKRVRKSLEARISRLEDALSEE